jgi:hypothetical protein
MINAVTVVSLQLDIFWEAPSLRKQSLPPDRSVVVRPFLQGLSVVQASVLVLAVTFVVSTC